MCIPSLRYAFGVRRKQAQKCGRSSSPSGRPSTTCAHSIQPARHQFIFYHSFHKRHQLQLYTRLHPKMRLCYALLAFSAVPSHGNIDIFSARRNLFDQSWPPLTQCYPQWILICQSLARLRLRRWPRAKKRARQTKRYVVKVV